MNWRARSASRNNRLIGCDALPAASFKHSNKPREPSSAIAAVPLALTQATSLCHHLSIESIEENICNSCDDREAVLSSGTSRGSVDSFLRGLNFPQPERQQILLVPDQLLNKSLPESLAASITFDEAATDKLIDDIETKYDRVFHRVKERVRGRLGRRKDLLTAARELHVEHMQQREHLLHECFDKALKFSGREMATVCEQEIPGEGHNKKMKRLKKAKETTHLVANSRRLTPRISDLVEDMMHVEESKRVYLQGMVRRAKQKYHWRAPQLAKTQLRQMEELLELVPQEGCVLQ